MKSVSISNKFLSLLLSGTLAFTLVGCNSRKPRYIPFNEIFYDVDSDGIDDAFENRISDSSEQIQNMIILEKDISLIHRLLEIDFDDIDEVYSISDLMNDSQNITLDDLEQIESKINLYNETGSLNLKKDLYRDLLLLINYVQYRGNTTMYNFGNRLYDSIILDAGNFVGDEDNIYALVDEFHGGSMSTRDYARYNNGDDEMSIKIDDGSQLYKLIAETGRYQNYRELPYQYDLYISYDSSINKEILEIISKLEDSIAIFKEAMVTDYDMVSHKKRLFEQYHYDKDIICGEPDTSEIVEYVKAK